MGQREGLRQAVVLLCLSFKNANWSKEGSPFGNTLKKKNYSYLLLPDPLAIQSKA